MACLFVDFLNSNRRQGGEAGTSGSGQELIFCSFKPLFLSSLYYIGKGEEKEIRYENHKKALSSASEKSKSFQNRKLRGNTQNKMVP